MGNGQKTHDHQLGDHLAHEMLLRFLIEFAPTHAGRADEMRPKPQSYRLLSDGVLDKNGSSLLPRGPDQDLPAKTDWIAATDGSTMLSAAGDGGHNRFFRDLSSTLERSHWGIMKITDTIEALLRTKGNRQVFSVSPEQSVYEAIEKMALEGIGAVLVISENKLVGIMSEHDYAAQGHPQGPLLEGHAGERHHDYACCLCDSQEHCR